MKNMDLFGNPQQELFAKVNSTSLDITDERIAALKQLFPAIVTDGKIDWGMLKAMLGESLEKESERYRFTWNGKNAAIMEAQTVSSKTLVPDIESSKNWDTTENLYIEGDNLEVLKLLQNSYNGKIKMIYIDPPYNTGNDFIYEDDFVLSQEEMEANEEIKDKKGAIRTLDRLQKNDKGSAKYHTNWLNMMYPRLSLARDLLMEEGLIFISIGDDENDNLKKICDEIYGEDNFVAKLIWDKNNSAQAGIFKVYHEYVIVYGKNIKKLSLVRKETGELFEAKAHKRLSKRHPQQPFIFPAGTRFNAPDGTKLEGRYGGIESLEVIKGVLEAKNGKTTEDVEILGSYTQMNQMKDYFYGNKDVYDTKGQKVVEFYFTGTGKLNIVKERGVVTPSTVLNQFGSQGPISTEVAKLFKLTDTPLNSPKNYRMIQKFCELFSNEDSVILDFFSGSATTAHAVMQLNAEDGGNRKYIMVQLPEETDEKSEAYKAGYKNICEIGKERIRKAGEKIISENPEAVIDAGFKVFKVETSNIKEWDTEYPSVESSINLALSGTLSMFKENRSSLDIVYELILKERLPLTASISSEEINDSKLFNINEGMMYIYLGELNDIVVRRIVELKNESFDDNPKVILDESKLTTEMKSNAKKTFDSNGIKDVRTI